MSNISLVVTGLSAIVGGTLGAGLTGYFGIRVKRQKRRQTRRAEVYVDILAWIGTRMLKLAQDLDPVQPDNTDNGDRADAQQSGEISDSGAGAMQVSADTRARTTLETKARTTFPDPAAMLNAEDTDPGSQFFVALRARVSVFGSHDMARAFDNWTDAYRLTLPSAVPAYDHYQNLGGAPSHPGHCRYCALLALVTEGSTGTEIGIFRWLRHKELRVMPPDKRIPADKYRKQTGIWNMLFKESDAIDGMPGCLTRAVVACASEELRKG